MSRKGWLLFAAMCVIWGIPYLLIRVAVRDVNPAFLVCSRTLLGGLMLLPFALAKGGFRVAAAALAAAAGLRGGRAGDSVAVPQRRRDEAVELAVGAARRGRPAGERRARALVR